MSMSSSSSRSSRVRHALTATCSPIDMTPLSRRTCASTSRMFIYRHSHGVALGVQGSGRGAARFRMTLARFAAGGLLGLAACIALGFGASAIRRRPGPGLARARGDPRRHRRRPDRRDRARRDRARWACSTCLRSWPPTCSVGPGCGSPPTAPDVAPTPGRDGRWTRPGSQRRQWPRSWPVSPS